MYYATSDEMAHLDKLAVESGLEIRQMMELAGWHMLGLFEQAKIAVGSSVAIVVGKGNKGGDGLSAARHLANHGYEVTIYLLERNISPDSQHHLELLNKMDSNIYDYESQSFDEYDVVVDSLIGYRLKGEPRGNYKKAISNINKSSAKVISYDLPTGVDATTGEVIGQSVRADYTLMLALAKKALTNSDNSQQFGRVLLVDIGIPKYIYDQLSTDSRPLFTGNGLLTL